MLNVVLRGWGGWSDGRVVGQRLTVTPSFGEPVAPAAENDRPRWFASFACAPLVMPAETTPPAAPAARAHPVARVSIADVSLPVLQGVGHRHRDSVLPTYRVLPDPAAGLSAAGDARLPRRERRVADQAGAVQVRVAMNVVGRTYGQRRKVHRQKSALLSSGSSPDRAFRRPCPLLGLIGATGIPRSFASRMNPLDRDGLSATRSAQDDTFLLSLSRR